MMIRAFIVDWNNQPVRNTALTIGIGRLAGGGEINGYGSAVFQTESDADGRLQTELRIPSVDWIQMAVSVEDPQREAMGWIEPVKVLIDGHGDLGTIKIYETREKYPSPILSGRVLSEAGKPVSPVFVTVGPSMDFEIEIQGFNPGTQVPLDRERGQVILDQEGYFQVFGPDTWESVEVTALSPGFHDESQSVSVPTTGIQLTLYRRLQLAGKLIVPENGPPIGEFGIWLSQEGGGIGITPRSDGTFSGQGSSQSLNLQITHPTLGAVLFRNDFVAAPTEEAGLGTIDLRDLVHVVDVTVVDMDGNPLANQELTIAAEELQTIGGPFTTDGEGRLLTLIPRHITTIHLSKRGGFVTTKVEPVELMLPSSPTRVTMP
ncbi:MAG: hypothetical protein P1V35_03735 [Planctomycetota bacterium]|nr:hypothetical protein [Planctomycetota bacterium]